MADEAEWPLPPFVQIEDFLALADHAALIDWVMARQGDFQPATVGGKSKSDRLDPAVRIGLVMRDLGPLRERLERQLAEALPMLTEATGIKGPEPSSIELELAAHGDGAHYEAHLDIPVGEGRRSIGARPGEDRALSAVYYFYNEPKAFSGGELRLYRFGAQPAQAKPGSYVDVEPVNNSLVAFPSWTTHEVRQVSCPSEAFRDFRFALNCWYCRKL